MNTSESYPAYLALVASGELERRAQRAHELMKDCVLCANHCHVNRFAGIRGVVCRTGERALVEEFGAHHGEEPVLSGRRGSGAIFFSNCNLRCNFCQNWEISQGGSGREVTAVELASMMLELQRMGCHNINLVSPSHVVAQILAALSIAAGKGLRLPIVFNTGGYDSLEGLALLDGVVDVYMPDMKFGDSATGRQLCRVKNYASMNRAAVKEMHRQVGDLVLNEEGLARRGLLVRHLVLPAGIAHTGRVLKFLAEEISPDTYLNLMDQYRPSHKSFYRPPMDRRITASEFDRARALAAKYGLKRLDHEMFRS